MLSTTQRVTILELFKRGQGSRPIAGFLKLSRRAVERVIVSQSSESPRILRPQKAEPHVSSTGSA